MMSPRPGCREMQQTAPMQVYAVAQPEVYRSQSPMRQRSVAGQPSMLQAPSGSGVQVQQVAPVQQVHADALSQW